MPVQRPTWPERYRFLCLGVEDVVWGLLGRRYETFLWGITRARSERLERSGKNRARRAFYRALDSVPAYADHVQKRGITDPDPPETDKKSYIVAYPPEARCRGGKLPLLGTMIDESSGSTGVAFNWVRCPRERHESHVFVSYFARYCFGDEPTIVINAFSMGAWATGINMGVALHRNGIVKNTGPDIAKILSTMSYFGPGCRYLLVGYPPFMKQLLDEARRTEFPWATYRADALVGGEGMSEGLRDYLKPGFRLVFSGYGATDLELGIAGETPLSVAIRRLARDNPAVRSALFGVDPRLPMVFQFNPIMHHIEVTEGGELMFTINRRSILSPRVRYNIHDEGGVATYRRMGGMLKDLGVDIGGLSGSAARDLRLPFLWVYGRQDSTISVMGANIYPEDLEVCLYSDPHLAQMTRSFCQALSESAGSDVRPAFYFEISEAPSEKLRRRFADAIFKKLIEINLDYRSASAEYPEVTRPEVYLFKFGEGPFAANAGRIKQIRRIPPAGAAPAP